MAQGIADGFYGDTIGGVLHGGLQRALVAPDVQADLDTGLVQALDELVQLSREPQAAGAGLAQLLHPLTAFLHHLVGAV